ncbi:MAG: acyl carrier protein [Coriobacteriia bacterium]
MSMDRSEIERTIVQSTAMICKIKPESLSMETRFKDDLKLRSMQAVKLTMLLEDAFDIKMPIQQVLKNETLMDCANQVSDILAQAE